MKDETCATDQRLTLRLANKGDCSLLWELANDPSVRLQSLSMNPIPWESHIKWFNEKINDINTIIILGEDEEKKIIGVRRFEIQDDKSVRSSIIIRNEFRSKGYGTELIKISNEYLFKNYDVQVHNAYIKPNNIPSLKSFEKLGYINRGIVEIDGQKVVHLTFSKDQVES